MAKVDIFNECTVFRKGYFKLKYKHMKSIIYCRVSSREQEETGYSLESQEKFLKEYADKQAFAIAKAYKVTESASKWQIRTTLKEMLEYAEENNINVILVEKIDRLTRSLKDAAIVNDWVHQRGEREVHFTKENFVLSKNTRSHENLVWDMKVAIARFYTNNLSEEGRARRKKLQKDGFQQSLHLGTRRLEKKVTRFMLLMRIKRPLLKKHLNFMQPATSLFCHCAKNFIPMACAREWEQSFQRVALRIF